MAVINIAVFTFVIFLTVITGKFLPTVIAKYIGAKQPTLWVPAITAHYHHIINFALYTLVPEVVATHKRNYGQIIAVPISKCKAR